MEDLTKHQLILLVLLITFVTSIATGIITFTLLQEAPVEVTQTINRVVEKTIEKVVPVEGQPEKVITTVVVNEEDRVLEAIAKNEKSIVRIKTIGADGSEIFAGLGLVIGPAGTVVTDLRNYSSNLSYAFVFYDGKRQPAGRAYVDNENGLVFMKTNVSQTENQKYTFYPVIFGNSDLVKIGQTIVALAGKESNSVSIGRVRQLEFTEDKSAVTKIVSDLSINKSSPGSPILNLSGEVIGIEAPFTEEETKYAYMPVNIIKSAFNKALEELNK